MEDSIVKQLIMMVYKAYQHNTTAVRIHKILYCILFIQQEYSQKPRLINWTLW
jgi:hypothetical protein